MIRSNHYEVAFAAFLRERRIGFLPVDETRRAEFGDGAVKSLDFVVVGPGRSKLVIDVKGRRFPGGSAEQPRLVWQNWSTAEDVVGLSRWAGSFGPGFRGLLVFVYYLEPPYTVPDATPDMFRFRQDQYLIRAVDAADYAQHMRTRSRRWGTVHLPTADFRRLVRPFSDFLNDAEANGSLPSPSGC